MKHNVEKTPKVALCRACHGTGVIQRTTELPSRIFRKKESEYYRGVLSPVWRQRPGDSEREDGTGYSTI